MLKGFLAAVLAAGLGLVALVLTPLLSVIPLLSSAANAQASVTGVDTAKIPALAARMLPEIEAVLARDCPELPAVWVIAEVQAETSWDPDAWVQDSNGGTAGLYQMSHAAWLDAAGSADGWVRGQRPPAAHPVWDPATHLQEAILWVCGHLREMTRYLAGTDKPIPPLEAMAVCHIAGCSRVVQSATGIPKPGEAGCGAECADLINRYLQNIRRYVLEFSLPGGPGGPFPADLPPPAAPYTGGTGGCLPDPTGTGGCVTPATAWMIAQTRLAFGALPGSCWDEHAWNPDSDHPDGRACDWTFGQLGSFPGPEDTRRGWLVAEWYRANAAALRISYVIWQGQVWIPRSGWTRYGGGGVYDPTDPTGGHYDHVHVSVAI